MCSIVERLNKIAVEDDRKETAKKLLKNNVDIATIKLATDFSEEKILKLQEELFVEA